ncbi:MAG: hypothetical protein AMXMBFR34_18850 [Myxococcaceae bacterium]
MVPTLLMGNVVLAKTPRFGVLANLVLLEAFRARWATTRPSSRQRPTPRAR